MFKYLSFSLITLLLISCNHKEKGENKQEWHKFKINNLSKEKYPDNPDWGYEASDYQPNYLIEGIIEKNKNNFNLLFFNDLDTITLSDINLLEYIPTIPNHLISNQYMVHLSLVNQEWNRNQVSFNTQEFSSTSNNIVRVDLARNCLNSYLWEIIAYTQEDSKQKPITHGWFNFPETLYAELFEKKNHVSFSKYSPSLVNWIDPETKPIDHNLLAQVIHSKQIKFVDNSNTMYPLKAARKKKYKEIIFPDTFSTMKNLQTDSALFATFSPPGYYNKEDPRTTELGRIYTLKQVELNTIISKATLDTLNELKFNFTHKNNNTTTQLIIGGLDLKTIPSLHISNANNGWKNALGFSNHTFYETYQEHLTRKIANNPYYAYFSDVNNNWLDSHRIGVDGPIMHWDKNDPNKLHIWLLSFERHALVGHYILDVS